MLHLAFDNPSGCSEGLELAKAVSAAAMATADDDLRAAALAKLSPMTPASVAVQVAAAEVLLAALCRDKDARDAFAMPGCRGLNLLTQLLQSRVIRVQFAASAAVALYSTDDPSLTALASSGEVSGLFDSLVKSMEHLVLHMHDVLLEELREEQDGGVRGKKVDDDKKTTNASTSGSGRHHRLLSKEQLAHLSATQGTALWGCALSTAKDDSVEFDGNTAQRMLFLCAVSLEIAALSRVQVCLAGVFASLARDVEEAERIMTFMQHKKLDPKGSWRRAITMVSKLAKNDETGFVSKHGAFKHQMNESFVPRGTPTVSYTHLTLPTILLV